MAAFIASTVHHRPLSFLLMSMMAMDSAIEGHNIHYYHYYGY